MGRGSSTPRRLPALAPTRAPHDRTAAAALVAEDIRRRTVFPPEMPSPLERFIAVIGTPLRSPSQCVRTFPDAAGALTATLRALEMIGEYAGGLWDLDAAEPAVPVDVRLQVEHQDVGNAPPLGREAAYDRTAQILTDFHPQRDAASIFADLRAHNGLDRPQRFLLLVSEADEGQMRDLRYFRKSDLKSGLAAAAARAIGPELGLHSLWDLWTGQRMVLRISASVVLDDALVSVAVVL